MRDRVKIKYGLHRITAKYEGLSVYGHGANELEALRALCNALGAIASGRGAGVQQTHQSEAGHV